MAIVEDQKVELKWTGTNIPYYNSILDEQGKNKYVYTKQYDIFYVDLGDLSENSNAKVKVSCDNCGGIYHSPFATVSKSKNNYCSSCRDRRIEIECQTCGKIFKVGQHELQRRKTCSKKCSPQKQENKIEKSCTQCGKVVYKIASQLKKSKSGNVFCSNKCVGKYNGSERRKRIKKNCLICNGVYEVIPSLAEKSVTCSKECQNKWQSEFLVGENANNFSKDVKLKDRIVKCEWCKTDVEVKSPYKLKMIKEENKKKFCSMNCKREWYAKDWSQREEWKKDSSERAVKLLESGVFGIQSEAQLIVNQLLDDLDIEYVNEYNCKYVSIDNYLTGYNLMIEVMGTYWHTDPRIYNEINYQMQVDRIKNDKIKKTFIKNNYEIKILYLWEEDIINNPLLCKALIKKYIRCKGTLKDYHSLNYVLFDNEDVRLNAEILAPYMDRDIDDIRGIIKICDSKRRDMKQYDKWITFNCDNCGKEKEQLISHYDKNKSHCCSKKCAHEYRRGKTREEIRKN